MNNNWFKVNRELFQSELWLSDKFTRGQAWVDIIGLANFSEGYIRVRGNRIELERGQIGWSVVKLSARWGWSKGKVNRWLNELEMDQQIVQHRNYTTTILTIVNYEKYQGSSTADGKQTVQQTGSRQVTNKKVKKIKKDKNVFVPPTIEDIQQYSIASGYDIDAEYIFHYYNDAGWKDKNGSPVLNWKQKIRGVWFKEDKKMVDFKSMDLAGCKEYLLNNDSPAVRKRMERANPEAYIQITAFQ